MCFSISIPLANPNMFKLSAIFNSMKLVGFLLCIVCSVHGYAQFDWPVEVQYDSVWTYKNLKLIPIRFVGDAGKRNAMVNPSERFLSLPNAMKQNKVSLKENVTREGSDRSVIVVKNLSKDSILINRGDVVSGGKQDRMITETTIIPPGKGKRFLNVFCVEKGRWDKKHKPFRYYASADQKLKKVMDIKRTQQEVWKAIDERFKAGQKQTETWAYREAPKSSTVTDSGYIKFFTRQFIESDRNFCGFIAVTDNAIIGCDVYANTDLNNVQYQANLSSYIGVAVQQGDVPVIENTKVEAFIKPIFSDEKTRNKFLEKHGQVFRYEGKIIHIVAYGD